MSVDAYLELARIGDGQCFIPKDFISFVVYPNKPVAILPIHGRAFLDRTNYSTYFDSFDALCRLNSSAILAHGFFRAPSLGGILVVERKTFEDYAIRDKITDIGSVDLESHRKFWDSLRSGLWIVSNFYITGVLMEEDSHEAFFIPKECAIIETRKHCIWT